MIIYSDGRYHHEIEPAVPQGSGGFLHGNGVFSTLRLYRGTPILLQEHALRLADHASALGLPPSPAAEDIGTIVSELVRRNSLTQQDSRLRITWTICNHQGWLGLIPAAINKPWERWYTSGMGVITLGPEYRRAFRPDLKTLNYLPSLQALQQAARASLCPEAIILDEEGRVLEGAVSNVFAVQEGHLITPPDDGRILAGLTRRRVLKLARETGRTALEAPLVGSTLAAAEEIFMCNAVREIVPVVMVDGTTIGSGQPGPMTRLLQETYRKDLGLLE